MVREENVTQKNHILHTYQLSGVLFQCRGKKNYEVRKGPLFKTENLTTLTPFQNSLRIGGLSSFGGKAP